VDDEESLLLLPAIPKVFSQTLVCKEKGRLAVQSLVACIGSGNAVITLQQVALDEYVFFHVSFF
jgi:competence protein ComGC